MKTLITTYTSLLLLMSSAAGLQAQEVVEKTLSHDGAMLPYAEVGSGDTIVAVHGAVSDKRVWADYQPLLADSHHLVTYSRRYYGTGAWPSGEAVYDASVHAEDLAALIRTLDSAPVHLLTRSSGAYSAVIVAAKYPELVRSLVMFEPFIGNDFPPSAGLDDKSLEMIADFRKGFGPAAVAAKSNDLTSAIENFIEHVYEMDKGSFSDLSEPLKAMLHDNARTLPLLFNSKTTDKVTCEFLGNLEAPALVVRGGETDAGYALTHIKTAECIPDGEVAVIDGVTHDGAGKKPAELTNHALSFWNKLKN